MSFSQTVKEELSAVIPSARHCQLAELSALLLFAAQPSIDRKGIVIPADNDTVARKCFTLLQKTYNIKEVYGTLPADDEGKIISGLHLSSGEDGGVWLRTPVDLLLVKNSCCVRAFLRGAFICVGSMSNPEKGYHLEFACENRQQADQIAFFLLQFDIEAKIVSRKKYEVVYLKEGSAIVDLLNVMGAHVSLMNLENLRIVKEMRNSVNRRVNCEAANISKTVNASSRQVEDIMIIRDYYGFDRLPQSLRQMAEVRLENPDMTFRELCECLDPPVGKSGVNHRLRKLSELAEDIRMEKGI